MTERTPQPTEPSQPPRRVWPRVLLFLSLALNLVVVGVVVGALFHVRDDDGARPDRIARELGLGPFLFALDDDNRRALRDASRDRGDDLARGREAWRTALAESVDLLRRDPFDQERFLGLVRRQAEIAEQGRLIGQQELARRLSEMTPQDRKAFADRLERSIRFAGRGAPNGERGRGAGKGRDGLSEPRP